VQNITNDIILGAIAKVTKYAPLKKKQKGTNNLSIMFFLSIILNKMI